MITLLPIEQNDFDIFVEREIIEYARDKVKSGNWLEDQALEKSRAEFMSLLPDGLNTKDQFVYTIFDEETRIKLGVLWVRVRMDESRRCAFINEFVIEPQFRRQGFGKQALQALDIKMDEMGVESIALHVFAHNTNAIALYEKMGYAVTNLYMGKELRKTAG
ncbi:MAG: GNAT family N-acetyltransferase [Anaerolineales bacterium]|nr:MAG: GNAT family N-acetyltransferase [Anaerolineales bacterium]